VHQHFSCFSFFFLLFLATHRAVFGLYQTVTHLFHLQINHAKAKERKQLLALSLVLKIKPDLDEPADTGKGCNSKNGTVRHGTSIQSGMT
jgi:hypothetical protein